MPTTIDPSSELPPFPPGGVTAGVDWASTDHAVAVVDDTGAAIGRFTVTAEASGLRELVAHLSGGGVQEVAIERCDGQVVDALLAAGLTVAVISPSQPANLRSRYRTSGNEDDRFDAYVLADTLRTDRARLRPLLPDPRPPSRCAPRSARGRPCSPTGSGWRISSRRTSSSSTPARSGCSPTSTPRPACGS